MGKVQYFKENLRLPFISFLQILVCIPETCEHFLPWPKATLRPNWINNYLILSDFLNCFFKKCLFMARSNQTADKAHILIAIGRGFVCVCVCGCDLFCFWKKVKRRTLFLCLGGHLWGGTWELGKPGTQNSPLCQPSSPPTRIPLWPFAFSPRPWFISLYFTLSWNDTARDV